MDLGKDIIKLLKFSINMGMIKTDYFGKLYARVYILIDDKTDSYKYIEW